MRLSNAVLALYMAIVFASGIAVGALGHRIYTSVSVSAKVPPPRNPEEWRKHYLEEMSTRLDLNERQLAELNTILDATKTRYRELWDRYKPERETIRQEQVQQIRSILNDSQREEYEKMRIEREQKMQQSKSRAPGC